MTPEELNRTIDFIIQSQARLAAAQEQDRQERIEFQRWSKDLNRQVMGLIQTQTQLLELQSRRLDEESRRVDQQSQHLDLQSQRFDQYHEEFLELMSEMRKRHEETLQWLERIVEKITDRLN